MELFPRAGPQPYPTGSYHGPAEWIFVGAGLSRVTRISCRPSRTPFPSGGRIQRPGALGVKLLHSAHATPSARRARDVAACGRTGRVGPLSQRPSLLPGTARDTGIDTRKARMGSHPLIPVRPSVALRISRSMALSAAPSVDGPCVVPSRGSAPPTLMAHRHQATTPDADW